MATSKLLDNVQSEFEHIKLQRQERLDEELYRLREMLDLCESPLEQLLLLDFMFIFDGQAINFPDGLHLRGIFIGPEVAFHPNLSQFYLDIKPQFPLVIKKRDGREFIEISYRADFLITLERKDFGSFERTQITKLIVEADGHNYHEKTKEQAQYDKSRDRSFLAEGFATMRFTGREVNNDVVKAVSEIENFLIKEALKVLGEEPRFT